VMSSRRKRLPPLEKLETRPGVSHGTQRLRELLRMVVAAELQ
jgi:hypothetical protein